MKHSIKQAEQIAIKYERLKNLDSEVIKLERLCEDILEREIGGEVVFKVANKPKKGEGVLDSDGSLINGNGSSGGYEGFMFSFDRYITPAEPDKQNLELKLKDYELLNCLGAILNIKIEERKHLLKEIESNFNQL